MFKLWMNCFWHNEYLVLTQQCLKYLVIQLSFKKTKTTQLNFYHPSTMVNFSFSEFSLNEGYTYNLTKQKSIILLCHSIKTLAYNFICSQTYLFIFLVNLWWLLCCYTLRCSNSFTLSQFNSPPIWLHRQQKVSYYQTA